MPLISILLEAAATASVRNALVAASAIIMVTAITISTKFILRLMTRE